MVEIAEHVIWICWLGKLSLVTLVAIRVVQLVIAIDMAGLTLRCRMCPRQREQRRTMVERCRTPPDGCVTLGAVVIELASYVIGIRCSIEICCMTIPACHRQILIHAVDVATVTGHGLMGTSERKSRCCVVECRWPPDRRSMTWLTVMVEIAEHMIWICGLGKLSLVTLVAVSVMQLIITTDMAGLTLRCRMCSRQRKQRRTMVERCSTPISRGMTL
jgi:hypothetical protein